MMTWHKFCLYKVRDIIPGLHNKLNNFSNKIKSRLEKMKIWNSAQKHSQQKQGEWVRCESHKMISWRVRYNHNFYLLLCNGMAQILNLTLAEGPASCVFKVAWDLQKSK